MNVGLQVLLEDEHCLAVVKPAGQFVQGTWAPPGELTLEQAVRAISIPANLIRFTWGSFIAWTDRSPAC